jgi:hypothetical protein
VNGRLDWHERAACNDPNIDPELFWPTSSAVAAAGPAKKVCQTCPVTVLCAAQGYHEHGGVWGGLAERELRRARG